MTDIALIFCGLLFLVVLLLLTVLGVLLYSGLMHSVIVGTGAPPIGAVNVVYKYTQGPYSGCGAAFNDVTSIAPELKCFGIYYDDPKEVPGEKCRYIVGAILSEGDKPDGDLVESFRKFNFNETSFPRVDRSVNTTFPYNTTLSIFIAVKRVYPALEAYMLRHGLKMDLCMEIYDEYKIHYMSPLDKQDEFRVPELGPEGK